MSARPWNEHERLADLMAAHAIDGLSEGEQQELAALADERDMRGDELEGPVAALDVMYVESDLNIEACPEDVLASLLALGDKVATERSKRRDDGAAPVAARSDASAPALQLSGTAADSAPTGATTPSRGGPAVWGGWLAAAACLTLAVVAWWPESPTAADAPAVTLTLAQQVEQMKALPTTISTSWLGLDDAALAAAPHRYDVELAGEVVWDEATDTGFMVFEGLASNDPTELQYQLWIFDGERRLGDLPQFELEGLPILTQRPVDGGVFDTGDGTVIIPIDSKLPIGSAKLFAITVEPPGGVVVSDRDIVTLALTPEA